MMYITDAHFAKRIMEYMEMDQLTVAALEHILEFYDDRGEIVEFDPVGVCSYWTEYTREELCNTYKAYIKASMSDVRILDEMNKYLYAVKLSNGNFLTFEDGSC